MYNIRGDIWYDVKYYMWESKNLDNIQQLYWAEPPYVGLKYHVLMSE